MQTNEANVFLFIASIIIGLLIAMNVDLGNKKNLFLDVEQYETAYNERGKLQNDISDLQEQYMDLTRKINKFESSSKNQYSVVNEISEELKNNRLILGGLPVKGEGIKITLNDAPEVMFGGIYNGSMLIHDTDLVKVINDLRNAGAEAIAVNDHRIIYNSSGLCWGPTINFDGIKVIAPFYITAIGNKNVLNNYLETQDNTIKRLQARKCYVEIEVLPEVNIPAYNGSFSTEFALPTVK